MQEIECTIKSISGNLIFYNEVTPFGLALVSPSFGFSMSIMAGQRPATIQSMPLPNSPDMPPKRTKEVD